ncbi:MAG: OmpH family outer membrane protein, partial [Bacteroidetes bacterium]|nr:OmpH family outer membrane protein [Bacteroidota bacterium]
MRTFLFIITLSVLAPLSAQKTGFIDSDLILGKMPEYKSAQKQLDDMAAKWQQDAADMQQ